jgi:hypothetical protein
MHLYIVACALKAFNRKVFRFLNSKVNALAGTQFALNYYSGTCYIEKSGMKIYPTVNIQFLIKKITMKTQEIKNYVRMLLIVCSVLFTVSCNRTSSDNKLNTEHDKTTGMDSSTFNNNPNSDKNYSDSTRMLNQ